MAAFGLIVDFEIKPETADKFLGLITENARCSVADEPGCQVFDVLKVREQPDRVMLYEIYDNEAAFQAHIKMAHVTSFFAAAKDMIVKQTAYRLDLKSTFVKR